MHAGQSATQEPLCMHGVKLLPLNGRNYRLYTASLHASTGMGADQAVVFASNACLMQCPAYDHTEDTHSNSDEATSVDTASTMEERLEVPPNTIGMIIGRGGETIQRIQTQSGARVRVLPHEGTTSVVVIRGTESAVQKAIASIKAIVDARLPLTHFISLPLQDPALCKRVAQLQTDMSATAAAAAEHEGAESSGVDPSIFIEPARLHLTLGVMRLDTAEKVAQAVSVLRGLSAKVYDALGTRTFLVQLRGLEVMQDNPDQAHVLYADVRDPPGEEQGRVRSICELINAEFKQAELLRDENRPLKLHLTLMNTAHRNGRQRGQKGKARLPFRAGELLRKHGQCDLGTYRCATVEVARMGSHSPTTGGYEAEGAISLP
ncbi:AKAP7 2'5' RNA ligase-like domain-containing protein [Thamnocephalis sphaerospora]|uniref:AKAP7 2'5' RNA ligase-like domain-containing protein n=1 Tax=Thamnocephalis sphaerospora TaxID=78915 RepID=A0A4P9XPF2_9FUNG|nr:AKAP7 2'5' RNA ligase-like domain-containing protein [Thamnocephalis sphaerospora]|eukprot:RKP07311.1 AKAP7 2'5' RNA ligase-like domain-containing protein [Thamnocephalis sphaerospora]